MLSSPRFTKHNMSMCPLCYPILYQVKLSSSYIYMYCWVDNFNAITTVKMSHNSNSTLSVVNVWCHFHVCNFQYISFSYWHSASNRRITSPDWSLLFINQERWKKHPFIAIYTNSLQMNCVCVCVCVCVFACIL